MPTLSQCQQRYDDRHPDDYRGPWDDAAEEGDACMRDFDRREALRKRRDCEICGRLAHEMGSEARCAEHDSEGA